MIKKENLFLILLKQIVFKFIVLIFALKPANMRINIKVAKTL